MEETEETTRCELLLGEFDWGDDLATVLVEFDFLVDSVAVESEFAKDWDVVAVEVCIDDLVDGSDAVLASRFSGLEILCSAPA